MKPYWEYNKEHLIEKENEITQYEELCTNILREIKTINTNLEATKEELQTTRIELAETKTNLQTTRTELTETKTELKADLSETKTELKADLQTTRTELAEAKTDLEEHTHPLEPHTHPLEPHTHPLEEHTHPEIAIEKAKTRELQQRLTLIEHSHAALVARLVALENM